MQYKVTGQNRDSGARMVLEFEAESKAAAERKALQQGMSVNRVEDITDGYVGNALDPNPRAGRRPSRNKLVPFLLLLIIVVGAWYFRANIMAMIHH